LEGRDDFVVWLNCDVLGLGRGRWVPCLPACWRIWPGIG
jgi:hypothetical protein